jgi:hypothetical protein
MRKMQISKPIAIVVGLVVLIGGPIVFRSWWVSHPPKIPTNLHSDSIWIKGPPAPFFLAPRGVWLGCWFDTQRKADRCQFADYRGVVMHEDDYTSCDDKPPVSAAALKPRNHDQSFAFIFLEDRTQLWSATECGIIKRSRASTSEWCPLCKEPFPDLKQQSTPSNSR